MADCTGFIKPLDLECLLVNTFAGTMDIFIFLSMIFIAGVGAYFKMMNTTFLVMFAVFAVIMAQFMSGVFFLVILIAGFISFVGLSKMVKG